MDKSKSIKIDFPIFNMLCAMEKVYIYEDETTTYKQRAILCGTGPKSFTSYSNKVIVSFQANKFTAMEGFFGIYSEVDKGKFGVFVSHLLYSYSSIYFTFAKLFII